jgi:hypothetical protein
MSVTEKISKSLKTAKMHLENLTNALGKGDENSFADGVWHLAAEPLWRNFLQEFSPSNTVLDSFFLFAFHNYFVC